LIAKWHVDQSKNASNNSWKHSGEDVECTSEHNCTIEQDLVGKGGLELLLISISTIEHSEELEVSENSQKHDPSSGLLILLLPILECGVILELIKVDKSE